MTLRTLPFVRMCASVTGRSNLAISILARDLGSMDRMESRLVAACPGIVVDDVWVVPRAAKLFGTALPPDGRLDPEKRAEPWRFSGTVTPASSR